MKTVIATAALAGLAAAVPAPNTTTTTTATCTPYTRTPIDIPSGPIFETGRWCVNRTTTAATYSATATPSAKQTPFVVPKFHDDDGEMRLRTGGLGSTIPTIPKPAAMHGSVLGKVRRGSGGKAGGRDIYLDENGHTIVVELPLDPEPTRWTKIDPRTRTSSVDLAARAEPTAAPGITGGAVRGDGDRLFAGEYRVPSHDGISFRNTTTSSGGSSSSSSTDRPIWPTQFTKIQNMTTTRTKIPGQVVARGEPTPVPSVPKPAMHGTVINAGSGCNKETTTKTATQQKECRPTIKHTTRA